MKAKAVALRHVQYFLVLYNSQGTHKRVLVGQDTDGARWREMFNKNLNKENSIHDHQMYGEHARVRYIFETISFVH
jgi:hypothetical protein